jgi:hypothetical protein
MKPLALLILVLCAGILFDGCKKYPEGPAISLRSKKERVANTWKPDAIISDGTDSTIFFTQYYKDYTLSLIKNGSYTISYYVAVPNFGNVSNTESGKWAFTSNKEDLLITPTSVAIGTLPAPSTLQILKLYEKELWLRNFYADGKAREYRFSLK